MANYAHILKAIQFICMFILLDKPEVFRRLQDPATLVPGLAFVIFGQHLNARVYDLLGVDGVYYGFRFGKSIPWRTEWPYNSLRDPQYIGASSTLLGALILGAPSTLCFHWLSNYMYLMWLESRVPADVSALS